MKRITKLEIVFGLFALALIYLVFANDASISGFVVSTPPEITLVAPVDNVHTDQTSIYFMFEYPPEIEMKECSLIVDYELVKTRTGLLDPYDTRIRADMTPGTHLWSIECTDTDNEKLISPTRRLVIGEEEDEPELKKVKFPNKPGYSYEFELREDLELEIKWMVPNDAITVKIEGNSYEINILRIIQDYTTGTEFAELLIIPGNKRLRLYEDSSTNLDLNNDGQNDMKLALNSVSYRKASFTASTKQESAEQEKTAGIEEPTIAINPFEEDVEKQQSADVSEKAGVIGLLEIFLIGLIIILAIVTISTITSRKDKEKKYVSGLKKVALGKKKKKAKKKAVKKAGNKKKKVAKKK